MAHVIATYHVRVEYDTENWTLPSLERDEVIDHLHACLDPFNGPDVVDKTWMVAKLEYPVDEEAHPLTQNP